MQHQSAHLVQLPAAVEQPQVQGRPGQKKRAFYRTPSRVVRGCNKPLHPRALGFWAQGAGPLGEAEVARRGEPRADSGRAARLVGRENAHRARRGRQRGRQRGGRRGRRWAGRPFRGKRTRFQVERIMPLSNAEASRRAHHRHKEIVEWQHSQSQSGHGDATGSTPRH